MSTLQPLKLKMFPNFAFGPVSPGKNFSGITCGPVFPGNNFSNFTTGPVSSLFSIELKDPEIGQLTFCENLNLLFNVGLLIC